MPPFSLTDNQNNIVWQANCSVFGNATVTLNEIDNPIRFQGQYYDSESGLHYNHFRYYDPHTGRFISQDPIGLVGGINHYQYAPNHINWVDPFGLLCKEGEARLDRMLNTLVIAGSIDEATKNKILETAIASSVVTDESKSSLNYRPNGKSYRKEHHYDISGLDEVNGLIKLTKVNKSGYGTTETVTIQEFVYQHLENEEETDNFSYGKHLEHTLGVPKPQNMENAHAAYFGMIRPAISA